MATRAKQPAQSFGYWTGGGAALPIPYTTTTKKKPKKRVVKNIVSVEPNNHHRDMMGKQLTKVTLYWLSKIIDLFHLRC